MDDAIVDVDVLVVSRGLEGKGLALFTEDVEGDVELAALTLVPTACGVICTLSRRIVCPVIVAVDGNEEDAGV